MPSVQTEKGQGLFRPCANNQSLSVRFTVSQKRLKHLRREECASASNLLQCDESLPACQRCLQRHELCSFSERSPNSSIPTYEVPVGSPYTIKPDAVAKQPLKGIAVSNSVSRTPRNISHLD